MKTSQAKRIVANSSVHARGEADVSATTLTGADQAHCHEQQASGDLLEMSRERTHYRVSLSLWRIAVSSPSNRGPYFRHSGRKTHRTVQKWPVDLVEFHARPLKQELPFGRPPPATTAGTTRSLGRLVDRGLRRNSASSGIVPTPAEDEQVGYGHMAGPCEVMQPVPAWRRRGSCRVVLPAVDDAGLYGCTSPG